MDAMDLVGALVSSENMKVVLGRGSRSTLPRSSQGGQDRGAVSNPDPWLLPGLASTPRGAGGWGGHAVSSTRAWAGLECFREAMAEAGTWALQIWAHIRPDSLPVRVEDSTVALG